MTADGRHGDGSLKMKMEAMTRAAEAKDAEVAAMQAELRKGRERERRLEAELAEVKSRLERAEIAEERLAADMADLEAEALERALAHKRQVDSLAADLREKEKLLAAAAAAAAAQLSILKGNDLHASLLERASKSLQETHDDTQPTAFMKLSWWRWSQQQRPSRIPSPMQHKHHDTHIAKHLMAPPAAPEDLRTPLTAAAST